MPAVDSYVYAHASIGLLVHYHGLLVANLWKKTATRGWRRKETDYYKQSCYRADSGNISGYDSYDADFWRWSTNAGKQFCC